MTTNYHTDVSAGASATAATVNAPIGQLDARINPTGSEYASWSNTATACAVAGTLYPVASHEVSFTPAFAGQMFAVEMVLGRTYPSAAGTTNWLLRITDGAGVTVLDNFASLFLGQGAGTPAVLPACAARRWTAGAGDVGATRKAKLYVSHTVNATTCNDQYSSIQVIAH